MYWRILFEMCWPPVLHVVKCCCETCLHAMCLLSHLQKERVLRRSSQIPFRNNWNGNWGFLAILICHHSVRVCVCVCLCTSTSMSTSQGDPFVYGTAHCKIRQQITSFDLRCFPIDGKKLNKYQIDSNIFKHVTFKNLLRIGNSCHIFAYGLV